MTLQLFLLFIVVVTPLTFDFTNGFHDTGNAMAGSIATGALKPKAAVARHGTNDAQKTMGVIFLALISYGAASSKDTMPPL